MKTSKEWILSELCAGRWVAQRLASDYRKSLSHSLFQNSHAKLSLNALTLIFYKRVKNLAAIDGLDKLSLLQPDLISPQIKTIYSDAIMQIFGEPTGLSDFSVNERSKLAQAIAKAKIIWVEDTGVFDLLTHFARVNYPGLGTSYPQSFGTVYFGNRLLDVTVDELTISLCHELAHHELFLINLYDRLINPEFDRSLRFAPFQNKERPPIGRLHSLFALFRMILSQRRCGADFANNLIKYTATEESFGSNELTPFANAMLESMAKAIH